MFNNFITSYLIPKVTSIVGLYRMQNPEDTTISVNYIIDIVVDDLVSHYDPIAVKLFLDGDDDFFRLYKRSIGSEIFKAMIDDSNDDFDYSISKNFAHLFSSIFEDDLELDIRFNFYFNLK